MDRTEEEKGRSGRAPAGPSLKAFLHPFTQRSREMNGGRRVMWMMAKGDAGARSENARVGRSAEETWKWTVVSSGVEYTVVDVVLLRYAHGDGLD